MAGGDLSVPFVHRGLRRQRAIENSLQRRLRQVVEQSVVQSSLRRRETLLTKSQTMTTKTLAMPKR